MIMPELNGLVQYRIALPKEYESIRKLLIEVGWEKHVGDSSRFHQMLENSDRTVVAVEGSSIVGFSRAICDEVSNGYITMVAVSPNKRGYGIGRQMAKTLMGEDSRIKWVLTSDIQSTQFWEKLGFIQDRFLMYKPRVSDTPCLKKNTFPSTHRKTVKKCVRPLLMKLKALRQRYLFNWV